MPTRSASAVWKGKIVEGSGEFSVESGAVSGSYSVPTRFGDEAGTNPEELIGAAHASCFAMQLSSYLTKAGNPPEQIDVNAAVTITKDADGSGWSVTGIKLTCEGHVPGISEEDFLTHAKHAKETCPISKLLDTEITLDAKLV